MLTLTGIISASELTRLKTQLTISRSPTVEVLVQAIQPYSSGYQATIVLKKTNTFQ